MKKILIAAPNYYPETNAAAKRITATAEYLTQHGWNVTVVTLLPHYPQYRIYEGFDKSTPYITQEKGVRVIRFKPWIVPKSNLFLRLLSETLFSCQFAINLLGRWHQGVDVVMASSPYMFLGPLGLMVSRLHRKKFVWELRDLTWQYARATGKKSFGMDAGLEVVMKFTAQKVDALITATDGQLAYFHKRPAHALAIPNGLSETIMTMLLNANQTSFNKAPPHRVLYAGLLGYPQGLSTLVRSAEILPHIALRLVGDGPESSVLKEEAHTLGLKNVEFFPYAPFEELVKHYGWTDILVAHLRDNPAFEIAQPSKLWEYMATGKPVIYAGKGEAVRIIENNDVGICVPPEDPKALAEAIKYLLDHPEKAAQLGQRGRAFVEQHRRRSLILQRFSEMLNELVSSPVTEQ